MVESKFSLFQGQLKRVISYAVKLGRAALCIASERFNGVDMRTGLHMAADNALQRRLQLAELGDTGANLQVNTVDRSQRKTSRFGRTHRRGIQGKIPYKLPELSLAGFRTAVAYSTFKF